MFNHLKKNTLFTSGPIKCIIQFWLFYSSLNSQIFLIGMKPALARQKSSSIRIDV